MEVYSNTTPHALIHHNLEPPTFPPLSPVAVSLPRASAWNRLTDSWLLRRSVMPLFSTTVTVYKVFVVFLLFFCSVFCFTLLLFFVGYGFF
jgi:hypothetical protein